MASVEGLEREFSFSQTMILQALSARPEMRMNELAGFLGLSKANATGLIERLVRKGMVERQHGVQDRRVVLVRLTRQGRSAARRLSRVQRQGLARMMRRIPERNLAVFIETLEQLAVGLAETRRGVLPPGRP
ncbi:MAG: MarR family transcriptional regulator [candidate division WOR-3 bacterium]